MMEVNRLNPTKSIRIGGISHFAFVNGWLLRSWGRSCIAGNASKARFRSRRLVVAVGPPLSPFAVAVGTRRSQGGRRLIFGRNGSPCAEPWAVCCRNGSPCAELWGRALRAGVVRQLACGVGGGARLLAVHKGDGDPLRFTERLHCRNEKSPIPGALTVRWPSSGALF